jgi:hypothetical protein
MKSNGVVEIHLDRPRHLKFNHNAFCTMEDVLNVPKEALTKKLLLTHRGQRAMLYAALLHEDARLTLNQAGQFFDDYDPAHIMDRITEAMRIARPVAKEGEDEDPNVQRSAEDGTGTDSSNKPAVLD